MAEKRKIVVEITTIDADHCDRQCMFYDLDGCGLYDVELDTETDAVTGKFKWANRHDSCKEAEVKACHHIREPNPEERHQLLDFMLEQINAQDDQEMANQQIGFINSAVIAVGDHYCSDGPGYIGKVMMVMWGGAPNFYEAFTWDRDGKIRKETCEYGLPPKEETELREKLKKLAAMAQILVNLITDAHDTHIFDFDNGDEHPDDCEYCAAVATAEQAIAEVLNG